MLPALLGGTTGPAGMWNAELHVMDVVLMML